MAEEERLRVLIQETQDKLQPLITKPKLSEKLLGKPPFRFLHDVVTNVNRSTGFAEGLYTPEEMDSGNVQEKQQKLDFLEKIINCVGICLGTSLDVRPSKIVAGLEPENTNIFLQALAQAASDPEVDIAAAVRRTLSKEVPGTGPPAKKQSAAGAKAEAPLERKESNEDSKAQSSRRESLDSRRGSLDRDAADQKSVPVTRGSTTKAVAGGAFAGPPAVAKNLDPQIEACNGDMGRTKEMLEKLISRPKPNEKLLSKPPFRFLHDIVSEITKATGFGAGLFDETESDSSKVTEKAAKVSYLEKIIKLVGMQLNTIVEARPSKIVAGLEPENTNRFLQLLVLAATEVPDTAQTVRLVLDPEGVPSVRGMDGDEEGAQQQRQQQQAIEDEPSLAVAPSKQPATMREDQELKRAPAKDDDGTRSSKDDGADGGMPTTSDGDVAPPTQAAAAAFGTEEKRSMRPKTARQRPPKVKDNVKEVDGMGKAAPKAAVVIMKEGNDGDKSEDEEAEDDGVQPSAVRSDIGAGKTQHGRLVQDIIKEQKKEDEARRKETEDEKKSSSDGGIRLGRLKKPGGDSKSGSTKAGGSLFGESEIESLRRSIQVMCQSTNPLGKCMDYVHEDLAIMSKEHEKWQAEYRSTVDALEEQKRVTEEDVQSLRLQLMELDEQVREHHQKINSVRCSIAKNDDRIDQLLRIVVTVSSSKK